MLSSLGIGSGIDIQGIITQLMTVESRPLNFLQIDRANASTKLSVVGTIKSATDKLKTSVENLKKLDSLQKTSISISDETKATVSSGGTAAQGNYALNVTQLAKAHQIASGAELNVGATLGSTGTIQIAQGSNSFQVVIDSSNDTLEGIKNAINDASNNTGVTATILTVGTEGAKKQRLILNADEQGSANGITVTDITGTIAGTSLQITNGTRQELTAADDAIFTVDTFSVTRSNNTITDVIEDVTIDLLDLGTSTVTVKKDSTGTSAAIKSQIDAFVKDYNALINTVNDQNATSFQGDTGFELIVNRLTNEILTTTSATGTYGSFAEIGITLAASTRKTTSGGFEYVSSGQIKLDSSKIDKALSTDFDSVIKLFEDSTHGLISRLSNILDSYLDTDGIFKNRQDALNTQIKTFDRKIDQETNRLETVETRYRQQFTAMDTAISQLNTTSSFLTQQLANISRITNNSSNRN